MGRHKKDENPIIYFLTSEFIQAINKYLVDTKHPKYLLGVIFGLEPSRLGKVMSGVRIFSGERLKIDKIAEKICFSGQLFKEKLLRDPEDRS